MYTHFLLIDNMLMAWIRKIGTKGNAVACVIPRSVLRAMNLQKGDYVMLHLHGNHSLVISHFNPLGVSDAFLETLIDSPQINYGKQD
jgi:antitoxin component of MazEF toxin-antitoxin module